MKRSLLAAAPMLASALLLGVPRIAEAKARAVQPAGGLHVVSVPAAATVWLDGAYFGPTPLTIDAIPVGRHLVTLTKAGYGTQEFPCDVTPDTLGFAARTLAESSVAKPRRTGRATLHGRFDPASVRIDGARPDLAAGEITLVTGAHVVRAVADGATIERRFSIAADTLTFVALDARADVEPDHATRVVAPIDAALPDATTTIEGGKLIVRNGRHVAIGRFADPVLRVDGETVRADPPPMRAGGRVYVSLDVLERLRRP